MHNSSVKFKNETFNDCSLRDRGVERLQNSRFKTTEEVDRTPFLSLLIRRLTLVENSEQQFSRTSLNLKQLRWAKYIEVLKDDLTKSVMLAHQLESALALLMTQIVTIMCYALRAITYYQFEIRTTIVTFI